MGDTYFEVKEHSCKKLESTNFDGYSDYSTIFVNDGKWEIAIEGNYARIKFCPFCGDTLNG